MPKGVEGFVKGDPNCGAPKGGPSNFAKNKPWREAINRALLAQDGQKLRKLADALVKRAAMGDVAALKEIGDRIDGKAVQQVEQKIEGSIRITVDDSHL